MIESANYTPVFTAQNLRPIAIGRFSPSDLSWEPSVETDIYMVIGRLQQYLGYKYCCGVNARLVEKLTLDLGRGQKPDAILIDKSDDTYRIAEFKVKSSDFLSTHLKSYVDVLICWEDDVDDDVTIGELIAEGPFTNTKNVLFGIDRNVIARTLLPNVTISLKQTIRTLLDAGGAEFIETELGI